MLNYAFPFQRRRHMLLLPHVCALAWVGIDIIFSDPPGAKRVGFVFIETFRIQRRMANTK